MKYTKLGNSELNVSRICMGCMGFGEAKTGQHSWTLDEEHSREIIKRGLDLGVNSAILRSVKTLLSLPNSFPALRMRSKEGSQVSSISRT